MPTVHDGIEYRGAGTKEDPYIWEEQGQTYIDNRQKWIGVENEWVTPGMVVRALFVGFPYNRLPESVKALVDAQMKSKK
jgi:hypothetical protein